MYVTDCHCDSVLESVRGSRPLISDYNTSKKNQFLQLFACWTEPSSPEIEPFFAKRYEIGSRDYFGILEGIIRDYHDYADREPNLCKCKTKEEVFKAKAENQNIAMLAIEGARGLDTLEKLHKVYEEGVRFITLTWNGNNCIAAGCSSSGTDLDTGLTEYGKEFVKECGALGVAIDLSHASNRTMTDVLQYAEGPVFASHSNFRTLCNHPRNLPDEVAQEIVNRKGFIGLNIFLPFVKEGIGYPDYNPDFFADHAAYAEKMGWGKNVGFGFDLDGIDGYPVGIRPDASIHDQVIDCFAKYGLSYEYLVNLGGENFFRFLSENLK